MTTTNTQKIKLIDGWIEGCGDFLKDLHDFSNEHVDQRRFKGDDLVKAAGVSSLTTIYKAQTEGRLPPPDLNEKNRRLGATLEQVLEMQRYFKTSPSPLPGEEPQIAINRLQLNMREAILPTRALRCFLLILTPKQL